MNAIVDTLKTAFPRSEPQSPTEDNEGEGDGGKMSGDKKSKYDSRHAALIHLPETQHPTGSGQPFWRLAKKKNLKNKSLQKSVLIPG